MRVVTVARKPCAASSTTANVVEYEAGALNIDACRISYQSESDKTLTVGKGSFQREEGIGAEFPHHKEGEGWGQWEVNHNGRWPSNVLIVGTAPREAMDAQSGQLTSGTGAIKRSSSKDKQGNQGMAFGAESRPEGTLMITYGDTGGASRFFKQFKSLQSPKGSASVLE